MTPKVAVQLLIGQNKEPFLKAAIESVLWADYFTVCNTDPSGEVGRKNQALIEEIIPFDKMRFSQLVPDDNGHFSFAEARNKCIDMVDDGDLIFIVDADDVHYPEFETIVRTAAEKGVDSVTAHFYHLMVYKDIYQFVQPREIVYKKYPTTHFTKGVHELLVTERHWPITSGYHYVHYGYVKPQAEVFNRWKFYSDLEGDFTHYDGQNPDHILDDRITVSKPLLVEHPPAIKEFLEEWPSCPPIFKRDSQEAVPVEKVGLILLTYNDEEYLDDCLNTLCRTQTHPNFELAIYDMGSTDRTIEIIESYADLLDVQLFVTQDLLPLAETLNEGLDHFRVRHDIQYIGWIHPDMRFDDPRWLYALWNTLACYPKVGKISAANTRDQLPAEMHPGHEQCFIIRKDIVNKVGLFDENFKGIGGYEDWDYNRRILNHDGYKVMITPESKVYHVGMGTRSKRNTTADQIANAEYYHKKWNTYDPPV